MVMAHAMIVLEQCVIIQTQRYDGAEERLQVFLQAVSQVEGGEWEV